MIRGIRQPADSPDSCPASELPATFTAPWSVPVSSMRYSADPTMSVSPTARRHSACSSSPTRRPVPDIRAPVTIHSSAYSCPEAVMLKDPEYSTPNGSVPFTSQRPTNGSESLPLSTGLGAVNHAKTRTNRMMPIAHRTGTGGRRSCM